MSTPNTLNPLSTPKRTEGKDMPSTSNGDGLTDQPLAGTLIGEDFHTWPDEVRQDFIDNEFNGEVGGRLLSAAAEPALRRVGRLADGFMATNCTPDELAAAVRTVREEAEQHGRDRDDIEIAVHLQTFVTDDRDPWAAVGEHILYQSWKYAEAASRWGSTVACSRSGDICISSLARISRGSEQNVNAKTCWAWPRSAAVQAADDYPTGIDRKAV
jgi:hypothetical protein